MLAAVILAAHCFAQSQPPQPPPPTTLRGVLLEQLHTTHDNKDWFVPANVAVQGLTAQQASWSPGKGSHSVGQLAYHLVFWNQRELEKFKGETSKKFSGDNDETFDSFDAKQWSDLVAKLDQVMKDWEQAVQNADDQKLAANASLIAHIGTHNAYHTGQIIYVRKLQGSWNPENGVK
ncbi:MAG: DinB family protein [Acidobacteriales bacterium]|nr:DinB family protein [Terriglobales bacterium]